MRLVLAIFGMMMLLNIQAQQVKIIPEPVSMTVKKGGFIITPHTKIVSLKENQNQVDFLNDYLQNAYGFKLKVTNNLKQKGIKLLTANFKDSLAKAYKLSVDANGVQIEGKNEGLLYGISSLVQLFDYNSNQKSFTLPFVQIKDYPRFGYRGLMLDVGRHFQPVSYVKRVIDYMSMYKLNNLHWHLTEDQGWRIEIKKYPKLTEIGGWRNGTIIGRYPGKGNTDERYGGFYTQEEIKEVVAYAQKRFINVIPEIELPGHSSAAIAAYPELSCFPNESTLKYYPKDCKWAGDTVGKFVQQTWGVFDDVYDPSKEYTFQFLQDVLDEVIALFPSKYIHIGGDECPKTNWKRSAQVQAFMKKNNIKDEHALQSYFIQRIEKYINKKGRTIIGWDEILEGGLAPNAVVMSWRGEQGGIDAAKQKHDVIMTPNSYLYFDYSQVRKDDSVTIGGFIPIEKVYSYNPIPKELSKEFHHHIKGAQANLWSEYITNSSKYEYMLFPRIAALSEAVWTNPAKRSWNSFEKKLTNEMKRYQLLDINFSTGMFDLDAKAIPSKKEGSVLWQLSSKDLGAKIEYKQNSNDNWTKYTKPVSISQTGTSEAKMNSRFVKNEQRIKQDFSFSKSTGAKISLQTKPSESYPGDGAFTLVNGIINQVGLQNSSQFLGFSGDDCEAHIEFEKLIPINKIVISTIESEGSWIYNPKQFEISYSVDGKNFSTLIFDQNKVLKKLRNDYNYDFSINTDISSAKYLKVTVKNYGLIPDTLPGGGHKAWLFLDEIAVY
ncbi:MAG: beta-N-acetylhexosaminidase [Chitinophagaceae bacterium]|nr:MAG: beta-N-acetylhexosaminidase [Chitinophagaceae bacterium]